MAGDWSRSKMFCKPKSASVTEHQSQLPPRPGNPGNSNNVGSATSSTGDISSTIRSSKNVGSNITDRSGNGHRRGRKGSIKTDKPIRARSLPPMNLFQQSWTSGSGGRDDGRGRRQSTAGFRDPYPPTENSPSTADRSLEDPAPEHLHIGSDNDLSNSFSDFPPSLSMGIEVTLQKPPIHHHTSRDHVSLQRSSSLEGYFVSVEEEKKSHEDREDWIDCRQVAAPAATTRTGLFWRSKSNRKVSASDVASVGNASDTLVTVDSNDRMSGRDLHEAAKVALNAGDFTSALPLFEAILSAQVRRFGPCHPSVAAAMHNVGVCRQRMGQHGLAENLFQETIQIRRQTLGRDHLEVAATLSKLGLNRLAQQNFEAAHSDLREAHRIARKKLGPNHKTVAQMLCHLACFYFEAGELFSAQAHFQDALEVYRLVWTNDPDRDSCMIQLTDTLCNIGSIQNRRKLFEDAIGSFTEALDLQRGVFPHDHPKVLSTLDNLGYSYSKNREYNRALSCYSTMLKAQLSKRKTFTPCCFDTFRKQIIMYEKLKRIPDAIDETKETLRMQKSTLPRGSKVISDTKALLDDLTKKMHRSKKQRSSPPSSTNRKS